MATPARTGNSGDMKVLCREVDFSVGDGGVFEIGALPAGYVMDLAASGVTVETAFDAGTANTVSIGIDGTPAAFASALALGTKAFVPLGVSDALVRREKTTVIATFVLSGTAATAGNAVFTIKFNRIETT